MTADSYLELVLVFMGWLMNNALWNVITATGLFTLPLIFRIAGIWLALREAGEDEDAKGVAALARTEHVLYLSFVVMMFCAVPVWDTDLSAMYFDRTRSQQCGVNVPAPDESGFGPLITELNGQTAKVPLWWYLVHALSKGVTHAAVASVPCGSDFRQVRFEVQHTTLADLLILQEVQEFAAQCYAKAYYRLKHSRNGLTAEEAEAVNWIGSDWFLSTPGYYDYYTSAFPRSAWPYSEARDSGFPDTGQGGYPSCKAWWGDKGHGLRARLLSSYDKRALNAAKSRFPDSWEETLLRWLVSPQNTTLSGSGTTYMTGHQTGHGTGIDTGIKQALSSLGALAAQATQLPAFDALRQALPFVHAILLMALVVSIPPVMLLGAYEPKVVITLTFALFSLIFVPFWWELGGWLDDRLLQLLYTGHKGYSGGFSLWLASTGSDGWVMNLVLGAMYIALPLFWFGAMSWCGVSLGHAFSSAMSAGPKGAQQAGAQGTGVALSAVRMAAGRK